MSNETFATFVASTMLYNITPVPFDNSTSLSTGWSFTNPGVGEIRFDSRDNLIYLRAIGRGSREVFGDQTVVLFPSILNLTPLKILQDRSLLIAPGILLSEANMQLLVIK